MLTSKKRYYALWHVVVDSVIMNLFLKQEIVIEIENVMKSEILNTLFWKSKINFLL